MSKGLLVINAGSSSIKFSVFALPDDGGELTLVCRGLQENLGEDNPHFKAFDHAGEVLADVHPTPGADPTASRGRNIAAGLPMSPRRRPSRSAPPFTIIRRHCAICWTGSIKRPAYRK